MQYWLQHKAGAGFITLDANNSNRDVNITDPFTAAAKFGAITRWVRSLDARLYPGASTLPCGWPSGMPRPIPRRPARPTTKAFKDDFAPGTKLYATSVTQPARLAALASAGVIMLVNKTASSLTAQVAGKLVQLAPYQVRVLT